MANADSSALLFSAAESQYTVKDHLVPVEGGEITVRSVIPTSSDENATYPVLVWYHGGGKHQGSSSRSE